MPCLCVKQITRCLHFCPHPCQAGRPATFALQAGRCQTEGLGSRPGPASKDGHFRVGVTMCFISSGQPPPHSCLSTSELALLRRCCAFSVCILSGLDAAETCQVCYVELCCAILVWRLSPSYARSPLKSSQIVLKSVLLLRLSPSDQPEGRSGQEPARNITETASRCGKKRPTRQQRGN